jgi:Zn-dependent peptidase ImmA (M78 family)
LIKNITKSNISEKWVIYLRESDALTRKRFTLAHELGHYISFLEGSFSSTCLVNGIYQDKYFFRKNDLESNADIWQMESEANAIAVTILMPEELVKDYG